MQMLTIDKVLDEIADHSIDEQRYIEEILHKRLIEETRLEMKRTAEEINEEVRQGSYMTGSIKTLRDHLDD